MSCLRYFHAHPMMRNLVLLLACLPCLGHGAKVGSTALAKRQKQSRSWQSHVGVKALKPLANLLVDLSPEVAFKSASLGAHLQHGKHILANLRAAAPSMKVADEDAAHAGRRALLTGTAAMLAASAVAPLPSSADSLYPIAAQVLNAKEGTLAAEQLEGWFRPPVISILRQRLDIDFAVLLMRSSYAVADDLDFVPMDQFQKEMFLFRQKEWGIYKDKVRVQQGDLSDPNYFDFMSFVQYATIASTMRRGVIAFNELIDANGTSVAVVRDLSKAPGNNAELPGAHADRVGARILKWLREEQGEALATSQKASEVFSCVQRIAKKYLERAYMLDFQAQQMASGIVVKMVAPATLWSAQALEARGDTPVNDFFPKTVLAYMRECGIPTTAKTRIEDGVNMIHEFQFARALKG